MQLPAELQEEQRLVEAEVRDAFKGVDRRGGISWTQAEMRDNYGDPPSVAAAGARDIEKRWEDLVDDTRWNHEAGVGGFVFLDAIGMRYYLAPAMIRAARAGESHSVLYALTYLSHYERVCALFEVVSGAPRENGERSRDPDHNRTLARHGD